MNEAAILRKYSDERDYSSGSNERPSSDIPVMQFEKKSDNPLIEPVGNAQFVELRYTPLRILKLEVAKRAPVIFICSGIGLTVVLSIFFQVDELGKGGNALLFEFWLPGVVGVPILALFFLVILSAVFAFLLSGHFKRLSGQLRIDPAGLWLPSPKGNAVLLSWKDLLSVGPTSRRSSEAHEGAAEQIVFTFNSLGWDEEQRKISRIWGTDRNNRHTINLDLRAMAQRDHIRARTAIARFVPSNRIEERLKLQTSGPAQPSFTQLWLDSMGASPRRLSSVRLDSGSFLDDHRYEIVRTIASGGQATTYAALDHRADTTRGDAATVVLKEFVVPVHGNRAAMEEMFEEVEHLANLLNQIACPQIVKLYRTFTEDFRVYLVLEHLEGNSLREVVVQTGPLPSGAVLRLASLMCQMLAHLHQQPTPVIHRDFAPDNLILGPDGALKLIDFDVAMGEDRGGRSRVVGKPSYIAPEQFRGLPVPQSDLYSLGATLSFLLTGKDPVPVSTSFPRSVNAEIDRGLDAVVAKCTNMELAQRYQSANDLALALESLAE